VAEAIERLQAQLEGCKTWPPQREQRARRDMRLHRAFRVSDRDVLRREVDWDADRTYVVDPLGERIPGCWADMIYGEAPTFTAAQDGDQEALDALIESNAVPDELQEAVKVASSEGQVWWRIVSDRSMPHPTIEWRSRLDVYVLMAGRQIAAVAFVERLECPKDDGDEDAIWRYVEYQEPGRIVNAVYRASSGGEETEADRSLGDERALTDHPETADLEEEWNTTLDVLLAGRVLNGRGASPATGRSDYAGISDFLLALNEASTVGTENARLTGKKRAIVTPDMLDERGNFPDGTDVFVRSATDGDPDNPTQPLIQLEWEFDASALIEWAEHLADIALTRARVAPQLVGRFTEGAQTGPALRARLLDSILAAEGKARGWDAEVPKMLAAAQMVDQLPEESGGFGHQWSSAQEPPAIERKDSLPIDEDEQVARIAQEIAAEILSRETAIKERHPDWSQDRVDEELAAIVKDIGTFSAPEVPFEEPEPVAP
jgi:hypothetical protein